MQLAYLGFEVKDLGAWKAFARDILGVGVEGDVLRTDSRLKRFFLSEGASDDVSFIGWECGLEQFEKLDAPEASKDEAQARGVTRLKKLVDPSGIPTEIVYGASKGEPFKSSLVQSGFVGDDMGLGHIVVSAVDRDKSRAFYSQLLGFKLSDRIVCEVYGYPVDIEFFHGNARHHSVAIGDRQKKRIHHFMLEVRSMDDVGLAFDRALKGGVRIMQTLGKHPNDGMFSFYARTPSGFQYEFGWGGKIVDDATWQTTTYDRISEWGHHPPVAFAEKK
jgi:biphenyl-2,3-diol 1,2-dioxygenase